MIKEALKKQINHFTYFFEDFRGRNKAPESLVTDIVCNLDVQIFEPNQTIIDFGSKVEYLYLIQKGKCNLYGRFNTTDGQRHEAHIVSFYKRGWYGDFQIFLDIQASQFQLRAEKTPKRSLRGDEDVIKLYKLEGKTLNKLAVEYKEFGRYMVLRAMRRRSYFLSVLEEIQQYMELSLKKPEFMFSELANDNMQFNGLSSPEQN